ncbi:(2Fe-2S)-binding protein [Cohnella rhizosphaerae]|uniref:(2Fe-2S)-binding protein n=1 Tax=Cohnella rhizosphaerae TaxID=1457232 RepID=A0A9X4KXP4_9BACL|nr:(2Fe-2S)-binding protein [Cohnella rhizosphaerae]MDG0812777.1 (2Fe-2S)-binding protein [Cohnella rhizosphaerae]
MNDKEPVQLRASVSPVNGLHDAALEAPAAFTAWECTVNGKPVQLQLPQAKRLLDIVREDLGLTGTKRACEIGRCGACMVLVDGAPVNACLMMAYQCAGRDLVTIEGIAEVGGLHRVQRAFLEEGGYQCGYCTPGMIVSTKALLDANPDPSPEEVQEALSGNLCRCTGYGGILRAVQRAIEEGRESDGDEHHDG